VRGVSAMDHDYRIEGHINGRKILGIGSGSTDPISGVSEMHVMFKELAEGWDPRSIVLMCCDRSMIMSSQENDGAVGMYRASGGHLTIGRDLVGGRRWGIARNAKGEIMVDVQASSETDFRGSERFDRSRVEGGISHLVPGINGIASVKTVEGVMMQAGPNVVTVTTHYEVGLEDGSTMFGTTFYPHFLPEQKVRVPGFQFLLVDSIEQKFDGASLWVRTHSSVRPLVESVRHADPATIAEVVATVN
jgi:hypothetical protein